MNANTQPAPSSAQPATPVAPAAPGYLTSSYYGQADDAGAGGLLSPLRLIVTLRKRWLTILLMLGLALCAALFYLRRATPLYQSTALIELSVRRPRILNQQAAVIEDPSVVYQFEETLNTQLEKFRSQNMLSFVLACYRQAQPRDDRSDAALRAELEWGVSFALMRRTRLVSISFVHSDPAFAAAACSAYAAGAEASARAENRAASDAAVAWLEQQALTQKKELEQADLSLSQASQTYNMDRLKSERKTVENALLSFNQALVAVESQVVNERQLLESLNAIDLKPENASRLPAAIPRAQEVSQALDRWTAALAERDALAGKYTEQHPEMEAKRQAVALYHDQAAAALTRARNTTAANLALFIQQAESQQEQGERQSQKAAALERDILAGEMKLATLERARNAADVSYQGILSRIQEARLSADENTATVKLIEAAAVPHAPVRPRVFSIILLAIMAGLTGGVALALATEALEDHVVGIADLQQSTGLKVLAVAPRIPGGAGRALEESPPEAIRSLHEAFAGLRAILDAPTYRASTKVVLVTSSIPAEGKTTTSCQLALACARGGQKTLLVDFDLRRPQISRVFPGGPAQAGLLEYLGQDSSSPADIVYAGPVPNLFLIGSRVVKGLNAVDLVGGRRMAGLLDWARQQYDRIIIDTAPLGLVSDALALVDKVDCVLVMARPSVTRKSALRHTIARFQDAGMAAMAMVMNDVDLSRLEHVGYGPYQQYRRYYSSYYGAEPAGAGPARGG